MFRLRKSLARDRAVSPPSGHKRWIGSRLRRCTRPPASSLISARRLAGRIMRRSAPWRRTASWAPRAAQAGYSNLAPSLVWRTVLRRSAPVATPPLQRAAHPIEMDARAPDDAAKITARRKWPEKSLQRRPSETERSRPAPQPMKRTAVELPVQEAPLRPKPARPEPERAQTQLTELPEGPPAPGETAETSSPVGPVAEAGTVLQVESQPDRDGRPEADETPQTDDATLQVRLPRETPAADVEARIEQLSQLDKVQSVQASPPSRRPETGQRLDALSASAPNVGTPEPTASPRSLLKRRRAPLASPMRLPERAKPAPGGQRPQQRLGPEPVSHFAEAKTSAAPTSAPAAPQTLPSLTAPQRSAAASRDEAVDRTQMAQEPVTGAYRIFELGELPETDVEETRLATRAPSRAGPGEPPTARFAAPGQTSGAGRAPTPSSTPLPLEVSRRAGPIRRAPDKAGSPPRLPRTGDRGALGRPLQPARPASPLVRRKRLAAGATEKPPEAPLDPAAFWSAPTRRELPLAQLADLQARGLAPSPGGIEAEGIRPSPAFKVGRQATASAPPPYILQRSPSKQVSRQTEPEADSSAANTATASAEGETAAEAGAAEGAEIDLDKMAHEVYQILRRRLRVEQERTRGWSS